MTSTGALHEVKMHIGGDESARSVSAEASDSFCVVIKRERVPVTPGCFPLSVGGYPPPHTFSFCIIL